MTDMTDEHILTTLREAFSISRPTRNAAADRIEEYCQDAAVAEELLGRIRQWDMLDVAADGPYWKAEIDKVLTKGRE